MCFPAICLALPSEALLLWSFAYFKVNELVPVQLGHLRRLIGSVSLLARSGQHKFYSPFGLMVLSFHCFRRQPKWVT